MNRAQKRALERFPVHEGASEQWVQAHLTGICGEYIEGYEQAIKDLWHNVKDEQPQDGERILLINRNGEYGTVMWMMPVLHKEFSKWEKWAYIKDLIPSDEK